MLTRPCRRRGVNDADSAGSNSERLCEGCRSDLTVGREDVTSLGVQLRDRAGYREHRISDAGSLVVVYRASEAGVDTGEEPWAVVCERHGAIVGAPTLRHARLDLVHPEFCSECYAR